LASRRFLSVFALCFLLITVGAPQARAIGGEEILPWTFRGVAESDPLLAPRYYDVDGFYSFRPPKGWAREVSSPRGGEREFWRWRVLYRDPKNRATLEVGVGFGGPPSLDKVSLSRFMGDILGLYRRDDGYAFKDSGLFLYDKYRCVLAKGRWEGREVTLVWLFGEEPPGEHFRLVLVQNKGAVLGMERVFESVVASLRWPDLYRGKGPQKALPGEGPSRPQRKPYRSLETKEPRAGL